MSTGFPVTMPPLESDSIENVQHEFWPEKAEKNVWFLEWLRLTDLVDQPTKPSSTNPIDLDIANRFHNAADGETIAYFSPPAHACITVQE